MLRVCGILYQFYEEHKQGNAYLLSRVARYYLVALKTLMLFPVDKQAKARFVKYEQEMKKKHPEIYQHAVNETKAGTFVRFMRHTHYHSYFLIKWVPEKYLV